MGAISVSGFPLPSNEVPTHQIAADPITDYPLDALSVNMANKVTNATMQLILPYNTGTSPLKVFDFLLTSAKRVDQKGNE